MNQQVVPAGIVRAELVGVSNTTSFDRKQGPIRPNARTPRELSEPTHTTPVQLVLLRLFGFTSYSLSVRGAAANHSKFLFVCQSCETGDDASV